MDATTTTTTTMMETKLEHLLYFGPETSVPPSHKEERCLAALVVLANSNLVASPPFAGLWLSHQHELQPFCQRLLLPTQCKTDDSSVVKNMDISYARLVVILLKRILDSLVAGSEQSVLDSLKHVETDHESTTLSTEDVHKLTASWTSLMNDLLDFLDNISMNDQPQESILLTIQTLECINSCCSSMLSFTTSEAEPSSSSESNFEIQLLVSKSVPVLWKRYCQAMVASNTTGTAVKDQGSDIADKMAVDEPDSDKSTADANNLLHQTFQAILARASGDDNSATNTKNSLIVDLSTSNNNNDEQNRLHEEMEDFHQSHLLKHFTDHPRLEKDALGTSILNWLVGTLEHLQFTSPQTTKRPVDDDSIQLATIHHLPKEYRSSWHKIVLLYARPLALHPSLPSVLDKVQASVLKLILAHVSSPLGSTASEELRLLAWTTCAAWVDALGCHWMLLSSDHNNNNSQDSSPYLPSAVYDGRGGSSSRSWGSASHLCALSRLASGEWRIQLGYRLTKYDGSATSSTTTTIHGSSSSEEEQQRAGIVQGCGQLLGSLISYLTELADEVESKDFSKSKRSIPPEALLHLRDSLEDAFHSTYNYLFQLAKSNVSPERRDQEDAVILQMLPTLLTEFDVFDGQTNMDSDEVLTALRFAMENALNLGARARITTCLAGVLGSAREDSHRVLLLKEHELLGSKLQSFLVQSWVINGESGITDDSFLRSIPWTCHLTELWYSIRMEYQAELRLPIDARNISTSVIGWLRFVLSGSPTRSPEVVAAITSCAGCFITLQGGSPPNDEDGKILLAALQFCAAFE